MKTRKIITLFLTFAISIICVSCTKTETNQESTKPQIAKMKTICELATMDCYYHNVAKYYDKNVEGFLFWKKDKHFWVEYSGIVKVGIDASKLVIEVKDDSVTITIPEAKVLGYKVDETSLSKKSFVLDDNSANTSFEDQKKAISDAEKDIVSEVSKDPALLTSAQQKAKRLLEEYIANFGKTIGKEYSIDWIYLVKDGNSLTNTTELSQVTQQP